jgi:hypothetical protein
MEMKIASLERELPSGCVSTAHWTASKTDGQHTASSYGSIGLPHKDHDDPDFVPYDQLTEAQVIAWVQDAMGAEQVAALEANLDGQLSAMANPVTASGTPWSN